MVEKKRPFPKREGSTVDWRAIHRRIEDARLSIDQGLDPTREEKKNVLKARAEALAREPEQAAKAEEILELVEFQLVHERYGIELTYVQEVYPLKDLTPLPHTPPFILGIINVRGRILSVLDIKKFFDLPEKGLSNVTRIIIVRNDSVELGILADVVLGVASIPLEEVEPPLPTLTGIRLEYLRGVTKDRMAVLNIKNILSDKKIIVHDEIQS